MRIEEVGFQLTRPYAAPNLWRRGIRAVKPLNLFHIVGGIPTATASFQSHLRPGLWVFGTVWLFRSGSMQHKVGWSSCQLASSSRSPRHLQSGLSLWLRGDEKKEKNKYQRGYVTQAKARQFKPKCRSAMVPCSPLVSSSPGHAFLQVSDAPW